MASSSRTPRRSHVKSKTGCSTCKRRRVRCDEFRPICRNCTRYGSPCQYADDKGELVLAPGSIDPSSWNPKIENDVQEWMVRGEVPVSINELPLPKHPAAIGLSREDLRIVYHVSSLTAELAKSGGHMLSFGTISLPQFMELAFRYDFVKYSSLGLSAAHLSSITRSTALDILGNSYMQKACEGLRTASADFSQENADGVLAASIMSGWQCLDSSDYVKISQGTSAVLDTMGPWEKDSKLCNIFSPVPPSPTGDRRLIDAYNNVSESDLLELTPFAASLTKVQLFVGGAPELSKAARAMSDFVRNSRLFPPGSSSVEQYRVFTAVKTWSPWMPAACLGLGTRDLPVMVTMAHYHALSIATESYLPAAASVLFLNKRTEIIARIYAEMRVMELADSTEQCQVRMKKASDSMIVPMLYALRYRIQHGTVQYRRTSPSAAGVSSL